MKKLYADTRFGQIHARMLHAERDAGNAPLVCLHPAPSSGMYFTTVMPLLHSERTVVAPDYPGYGGSDATSAPPTIADYARALLGFLDAAGIEDPVDVLGFHTGCLVGTEMAIREPGRFRRLVLCDVPFFDKAQQEGLREKAAVPLGITAELDSIASAWQFDISSRIEHVPLARAFELFAEHLRAGDCDYMGFEAAFSFDCEGRFAELDADVVVLATQSGLHAPSERAAAVIPAAVFTDVPEVTTAVFESGAPAIAKRIIEALDR